MAKADGQLKKDKKADRGKSKEELKEEEENVIRYKVTRYTNRVFLVLCKM